MRRDELSARRKASALDAVQLARIAAERAGEQLRRTILAAADAGATQDEIGARAHLTRGRVSQIVAELRRGAR